MFTEQPTRSIEDDMHEEKPRDSTPPEDWRASFEKQATRGILEKLNRIARARLVAYAGRKRAVHDADIDDIVIGALGDTWNGTLSWDPTKRPLFAHLKDAIKYRVRNNAKLARAQRKHDVLEEDEHGESIVREIAAGAIVPTIASPDARDELLGCVADEAIDALRPLALRDAEVTSLLDVLAKRIVDRDDVLEETGMTIGECNNAWRRLGRLVRKLPAQLRDHALAALA